MCACAHLYLLLSGWRPLLESWLERVPKSEPLNAQMPRLRALLDWLLPPCLEFVARNCKEVIQWTETGRVANMTRIMESLLSDFDIEERQAAEQAAKQQIATPVLAFEGEEPDEEKKEDATPRAAAAARLETKVNYAQRLDAWLLFSIIWGVGGSTDADGRIRFSNFLRSFISGALSVGMLGD